MVNWLILFLKEGGWFFSSCFVNFKVFNRKIGEDETQLYGTCGLFFFKTEVTEVVQAP